MQDEKKRSVEEWLEIRKKAALDIDPATAEMKCEYRYTLDPYGVKPDLPAEARQIGREYFARSPGSDIWVSIHDLSEDVVQALWVRKPERMSPLAALFAERFQKPAQAPSIIPAEVGPNGFPVGCNADGDLVEMIDYGDGEGVCPEVFLRGDENIAAPLSGFLEQLELRDHLDSLEQISTGQFQLVPGIEEYVDAVRSRVRQLEARYGTEVRDWNDFDRGMVLGKTTALLWMEGGRWNDINTDREADAPFVIRRSLKNIWRKIRELDDKVSWNRHQTWLYNISTGVEEVRCEGTFARAKKEARRIERKYGKRNLGWDDLNLGVLNGQLSALRWLIGDDWDECGVAASADREVVGDAAAGSDECLEWRPPGPALVGDQIQMSSSAPEETEHMDDITNEEIVSLATLGIKLCNTSGTPDPSDMETYKKGLTRLFDAGFLSALSAAEKLLEGKPYVITTDNEKTVQRCRSIADYIGASVKQISESSGFFRIRLAPPSRQ